LATGGVCDPLATIRGHFAAGREGNRKRDRREMRGGKTDRLAPPPKKKACPRWDTK